ncbi:MAG TPA: ABC transporter permease, partial [Coleofasciculaceae cyanobacterium]
MNWWQKLKKNPLARFGAVLLIVFYLTVIAADFVAPYDPYASQPNGSLLPPTPIYWRNQKTRQFIGPHVYPTTQGPTDIDTGERELKQDFSKPSPIRLFVQGPVYNLFQLRLPIGSKFEEVELFGGIPVNLHLFGTVGEGKLNLLGTDEQGRDQFTRLVHGGRISLSIGLVGIAISFPLGLLVGGISGYIGGWVDAGLMRAVEVLMTIPSL